MIIALGKFTKYENNLFDIIDDWLWRDRLIFVGSSYLEGCNFLTAAVSTLTNTKGDFTRWCQLDGLWTFVALHGAFELIAFMLCQFKLAQSVQLRPYNAVAFSALIVVFVFIFLIYPRGQSVWFFVPSFGFHNWIFNLFHIIGVVGALGATFAMHYLWVAFFNKCWLHFFMLFVPVTALRMSALGVVGLALNLYAYDFVSQDIHTGEDPKFETFYTKNIFLK
ncbi:hypothetical protein ACOSQ4_017104 [Xanthoceras sorbifolium]